MALCPKTDWFSCTVSECAQLAVQCDYPRSATTAVRLSSSLLSASWWRWSEMFSNIRGVKFSGRIPHMLVVGTREFARSLMPGS